MALMQTLVDSFPGTALSSLWFKDGTVSVGGGQVSIAADTAYDSALISNSFYTLTGSYMQAKITPFTGSEAVTYFQANNPSASGWIGIQYHYGSLRGYYRLNSTFTYTSSVTYNAATMAYWRVRESGGTTYFGYSANGVSWTEPWSVADPVSLDSVSAEVYAGIDAGTAGTSYVANFNVVAVVAAAVSLSGSGTLGAHGHPVVPAAASLSGHGSFTASAGVLVPLTANLSGAGSLGATVTVSGGIAALTGRGSLTASGHVTRFYRTALSGAGTLGATWTGRVQQAAALHGTGTLGIRGVKLGYQIALTGQGYLSVPQAAGGLVAGTGGATVPQALPGSSQVAVAAPGSSNWRWLGTIGQVTSLTYSYVCPGGCDQMQATLMVPASYRTSAFNPGWQVKITRGGHQVWYGKLDEPQPSASGWTLTAVGAGNLGQNFTDYYSIDDTWPQDEPDEIINRAISRGLPWTNPGLNNSPYFSQFWFGQATDPGSQTVAGFLNLICTRGGLLWYVNSQPGGAYSGNTLSVFPLPTVPNRLLVCTTPTARTLGGYVNALQIRYMSVADNTTTNVGASYNVELVENAASIAAHGVTEAYVDLSDASVLSVAQVQAVGQAILSSYQAASFAGPFTASYGQLLNTGGSPIDPGTDQSGTMIKMILTDFAYGGSIVPGPVEWIVGAYSWDDFSQTATITPYQSLDMSLSGLLSMTSTTMTPITTAST